MVDEQQQQQKPLHHGNPPWHAVTLIVTIVAIFIKQLVKKDDTTQEPKLEEILSRSLFPTIIPLRMIIAFRLLIATIIFVDLFRATALVVYLDHKTEYYPGSELRAGAPIEYHGYLTKHGTVRTGLRGIASFTMVTWTIQGITFLLTGLLPLLLLLNTTNNDSAEQQYIIFFYQIAVKMWEIMVPSAFLVSLVVTYVLWPMEVEASKQGRHSNLGLFNRFWPLLSHNLNVLAITIEVALMGGGPCLLTRNHYYMAPLYGAAYVLFSWIMKNQWVVLSSNKDHRWGPQFIYPFLDTTLGWQYTASIMALLLVLLLSHGIVVFGIQYLVTQIISPHLYTTTTENNNVLDDTITDWQRFGLHCCVILTVGCFVCRFR